MFQAIVRPLGDGMAAKSVKLKDTDVTALVGIHTDGTRGFGISYDEVADALSRLPRLFLEPDGSLVWVSPEDPARKLNAQITDDGRQVMYVELRGTCRWEELVPILSALGWPSLPLMFQWLPESVLLAESSFRQLLESSGCG